MSKIACHPVCPSSFPWCWVPTSGSGLAAGWDRQYLQCLWQGEPWSTRLLHCSQRREGLWGLLDKKSRGKHLEGG